MNIELWIDIVKIVLSNGDGSAVAIKTADNVCDALQDRIDDAPITKAANVTQLLEEQKARLAMLPKLGKKRVYTKNYPVAEILHCNEAGLTLKEIAKAMGDEAYEGRIRTAMSRNGYKLKHGMLRKDKDCNQ